MSKTRTIKLQKSARKDEYEDIIDQNQIQMPRFQDVFKVINDAQDVEVKDEELFKDNTRRNSN